MTPREHARLARLLIDACGGLDEAAANCRVSKSKLSDYQNPNVCLFMPSDVMDCLQEYCGNPIFSDAMSSRFAEPVLAGDLTAAACEVTEAASLMQRRVRDATADKQLTPRELDELAASERAVEEALERSRAIRRAHETRPAALRAV